MNPARVVIESEDDAAPSQPDEDDNDIRKLAMPAIKGPLTLVKLLILETSMEAKPS